MTPSAGALIGLTLVGLLAATISATTGVAGGVLLLSVLLVVLDPRAVVPVHGAVQLVANLSRLAVFRKTVRWRIVARFGAAVVPGSLAGAFLVGSLSPRLLQVLIAGGILASVLIPPKRKPASEEEAAADAELAGAAPAPSTHPVFDYGLGLLCGALGMLVGSTGPLLSRFLLGAGLVKEEHVGTKAACQVLANAIKVTLFGASLGFAYGEQAALIVALGAAAVVGTLLGKRLLRSLSPARFVLATRLLLASVALKVLLGV